MRNECRGSRGAVLRRGHGAGRLAQYQGVSRTTDCEIRQCELCKHEVEVVEPTEYLVGDEDMGVWVGVLGVCRVKRYGPVQKTCLGKFD